MNPLEAMLSKRGMAPRPSLKPSSRQNSFSSNNNTPNGTTEASNGVGSSNSGAGASVNFALRNAMSDFSIGSLVKLLLHEVEAIDFKKKKERFHISSDHEILQRILNEMKEMLNHKFLNVDLSDPVIRRISDTDWSGLLACKRSEAGTTGIYFLQCMTPSPKGGVEQRPSVVVSKPVLADEFKRHELVNRMTADFFYIRCPQIRLILKADEEYKNLEKSVVGLFSNLESHKEMYRSGGKNSPKDLFSTSAIMLMELVKGKPLCHRLAGQRELMPADYRAVGRLFLLDLLIRNTDRLPCRKAMPRPGSCSIINQGNAGNLMFGDVPGSLWAIDPEMQTKITLQQEQSYTKDFHSVVNEIVHGHAALPQYLVISKLFFERVDVLEGILDTSLNELEGWDQLSESQQAAVDVVLQLIRVRSTAYDNYVVVNSTGGIQPPADSNEREWREWIRLAVPRAILDIVEFIEGHTGYSAPPSAARNIEMGFLESMAAARKMRVEIANPFSLVGSYQKFLQTSMHQQLEQGITFILRLIKSLEEFDSFLPEAPFHCCDENAPSESAQALSMTTARKKMRAAVHRIAAEKRRKARDALLSARADTDDEIRSESSSVDAGNVADDNNEAVVQALSSATLDTLENEPQEVQFIVGETLAAAKFSESTRLPCEEPEKDGLLQPHAVIDSSGANLALSPPPRRVLSRHQHYIGSQVDAKTKDINPVQHVVATLPAENEEPKHRFGGKVGFGERSRVVVRLSRPKS